MGLTILVVGTSELVDGEIIEGIYLLTGGLMFLLVASLCAVIRAICRRRSTGFVRLATIPDSDGAAVVIPYSIGHLWLYLGVLASMVVVSVAWGLRERSALHILAAIGFGALLAYYGLQICRKKIVRGYLALSTDGIYHRSWGFISFAPWEHVSDVVPAEGDGQLIEVRAGTNTKSWSRRTARFLGSPSCSPGLAVRGMFLSVDPVLAYYALLFYLANPDARSELGCDAGVQRLRKAAIPASLLHRYAYRATTLARRQLYGLKS
jgi:hypothetical protein